MTEARLYAQQNSGPKFTPVRGGALQRKCACGGSAGKCEACSHQNLSVQRSTRNSELGTRNSFGVPPIVNEVLRSPGQPLDATTRAFMEPRFGHDFSRVRVHSDAHAAESTRAIGALAYTMGQDIVFRPDQYQPQTNEGRHLLAHWLTHVIQQGDSRAPGDQVNAAGPTILENASLQREADHWADRITRSSLPQSAFSSAVQGSAPLSVQLQEDPATAKKAPEAPPPEKTPLESAT